MFRITSVSDGSLHITTSLISYNNTDPLGELLEDSI